jgi:hypothetical protein
MSSATTSDPPSLKLVLWLLPIVFIVHDLEELLSMPGWIAGHQRELDQISTKSDFVAEMLRNAPKTFTQFAVAIGFVMILFVAVTIGASMSRRHGLWMYAYGCLLGVLFLHVFAHIAQAILVAGYVPGLIGAVAAVIPGSVYIYRRLFRANLLTLKEAVLTGLIGLALFLPGVLLAHSLGRFLIGN